MTSAMGDVTIITVPPPKAEPVDIDPDVVTVTQRLDNAVVNNYYCKVCETTMIGLSVYASHVIGARHKKNIQHRELGVAIVGRKAKSSKKKSPDDAAPENIPLGGTLGKSVFIQTLLDDHKDPLIGIQYITEYQDETCKTYLDTRYVCGICASKCDCHTLLTHLVGVRHRSKYLIRHHGRLLEKLRLECSGKEDAQPLLAKYAVLAAVEDGRKYMKVVYAAGVPTHQQATNACKSQGQAWSRNQKEASLRGLLNTSDGWVQEGIGGRGGRGGRGGYGSDRGGDRGGRGLGRGGDRGGRGLGRGGDRGGMGRGADRGGRGGDRGSRGGGDHGGRGRGDRGGRGSDRGGRGSDRGGRGSDRGGRGADRGAVTGRGGRGADRGARGGGYSSDWRGRGGERGGRGGERGGRGARGRGADRGARRAGGRGGNRGGGGGGGGGGSYGNGYYGDDWSSGGGEGYWQDSSAFRSRSRSPHGYGGDGSYSSPGGAAGGQGTPRGRRGGGGGAWNHAGAGYGDASGGYDGYGGDYGNGGGFRGGEVYDYSGGDGGYSGGGGGYGYSEQWDSGAGGGTTQHAAEEKNLFSDANAGGGLVSNEQEAAAALKISNQLTEALMKYRNQGPAGADAKPVMIKQESLSGCGPPPAPAPAPAVDGSGYYGYQQGAAPMLPPPAGAAPPVWPAGGGGGADVNVYDYGHSASGYAQQPTW